MIKNPKHGWCDFQLGDFTGVASYLTDVPIDLLDAFISYYTYGYGVVVFDQEGSYFTLVLTAYNFGIYIIEESDKAILHDFSIDENITVNDLAKELINDIENDLEGWSTDFLFYVNQKEAVHYCNKIKQKLAELKKLIK